MRKNSPRKWLHACLDLLPVILIPVFMIYSHRHDVTENVQVTYKYESNEVNSLDDLVEGNIYSLNLIGKNISHLIDDEGSYIYFELLTDFNLNSNAILEEITPSNFQKISANTILSFDSSSYISLYDSDNRTYGDYLACFEFTSTLQQNLVIRLIEFYDVNVIDISYTDYNVIESVDTTNSNVMDSFVNNFNNTIDKHFNMGNVFNLTGVYDWFNTNIFNGNAPQVIYSVWNIALYELVMDLLFLLYGLFMWFIDMVQYLMEKPFKSIK